MEPVLNPKRGTNIQEEAAEWLLARRQGLDVEQTRRFVRWLATSPRHLAEYHAMERLGRDLPRAMSAAPVEELLERARGADEEEPDDVVELVSARLPARTVRRHYPAWARAAAVAFVALAVALLWRPLGSLFEPRVQELSLATERGQRLTRPLEDGSVIELDADSSVVVLLGAQGRQVRLLRGRAMFQVEHDAARPFEVTAGAARIVDVGTKFTVDLRPDGTVVTVTEGLVDVSAAGSPDGSAGTRLGAGEQLRVSGGAELAAPVRIDPVQATAWLRGELVFSGSPLAQAVAEWNRYSKRPIEIRSADLGRRPITSSHRTGDLDGFLEFLRLQGMHVEVTPDDRIVLSEN